MFFCLHALKYDYFIYISPNPVDVVSFIMLNHLFIPVINLFVMMYL